MTTHAIPMSAPAETTGAAVTALAQASLSVLRFLLDVLTVLVDLLATIVWTAVATGFAFLAALGAYADGGPGALVVMVIALSGVIVICLQLWLGMVLIPRYDRAVA